MYTSIPNVDNRAVDVSLPTSIGKWRNKVINVLWYIHVPTYLPNNMYYVWFIHYNLLHSNNNEQSIK